MSVVVVETGARVLPGDIIFRFPLGTVDRQDGDEVLAGAGCYERCVADGTGTGSERVIVASLAGIAQWDGPLVRVYPARREMTLAAAGPSHIEGSTHVTKGEDFAGSSSGATATGGASGSAAAGAVATDSASTVLGPRPGDHVHLRVTRVGRLFASGEIIAINGRWSSNKSSTALGMSGLFRGVLRLEDIRPFRPTKDQLQPRAPSLAFCPGDVVVAEVISQSDARQYQLSTIDEQCGVVDSFVSTVSGLSVGVSARVKLQHVPGRREVMMNPEDRSVVPRWCPLLPL